MMAGPKLLAIKCVSMKPELIMRLEVNFSKV
jgi:hypothetical protein